MREPHQLLFSRTRVRPRFAILPLEGIPKSRLPAWPAASVYVLASPELGAQFVQCKIDLETGTGGRHRADGRIEHFLYVLEGQGSLQIDGQTIACEPGSYALVPPDSDYQFTARSSCSLTLLRKEYEPVEGVTLFRPLVGHVGNVPGEPFCGDPGARLQTLIPDDWAYDLAMNVFTFEVGHSLPVVETHVMEHGLIFLQGKGLYFLEDRWMEVEPGDFVWMGPYCPQSFYATGPVASKYLYYKNVNREIRL